MKKQVFLPLMLALALLTGCTSDNVPQKTSDVETGSSEIISYETESVETRQKLCITVSANDDAYKRLQPDELCGNFSYSLDYRGVENVQIELDGESMPLEDALAEGRITDAEIFSFARTDARNGFCEETVESSHGLSHFTYHYPEVNIRLIYDVYETPDGNQHLISHMAVYVPRDNEILGPYTDFLDKETGLRLDREDWGLDFVLSQISSTGLTLTCQQSGGQQIGQLRIECYLLQSIANGESTDLETLTGPGMMPTLSYPVEMNGTGQVVIDWTDSYGELPHGEYKLVLDVYDRFEQSQVHPLMEDYTSRQLYELTFTIS